jgi:hypothetical protein
VVVNNYQFNNTTKEAGEENQMWSTNQEKIIGCTFFYLVQANESRTRALSDVAKKISFFKFDQMAPIISGDVAHLWKQLVNI